MFLRGTASYTTKPLRARIVLSLIIKSWLGRQNVTIMPP